MELIRSFSKIGKKDVDLAGGKGASLGEMTRADIPVPPGFVLLSTGFERFLKEAGLDAEIDAAFHRINHDEIRSINNASQKIQTLILRTEMPEDMVRQIRKFFLELGSKYVAVRSSATAEDGFAATWAGQLESFLNTTEESLFLNVKKCWASLFTPRAIFYRFEKGLDSKKISVGVVIQKMIDSEVSGVAFSVHPVTQDFNQLIIEAGFGLGEAIVSGQVTPDSYVVEKEPMQILDTKVNSQNRALRRGRNGGVEWYTLSSEEGDSQVLSGKKILELSEIILKIEDHYKFPCDVEWVYEDGRFYIVQSRPITTLVI